MNARTIAARVGALAVVAVLAVGCGGGGNDRPTLGDKRSESTGTAALPPGTSQVAQVTVPNIEVFESPGASEPKQSFENPWHINNDPKLGVPLVFLVEQQQGKWVQVLLPVRPNGTTGWVHASDVNLTSVPYRIQVELGSHRITVYDGEQELLQEPVAIGASDTPTPTGKYYLRVLLEAPDPDTVYGPYAYGLSGHSNVLEEFHGGDGELGIHGHTDASVLGQSITHGCIRMSNDGITRLTKILPLGTPVEITS